MDLYFGWYYDNLQLEVVANCRRDTDPAIPYTIAGQADTRAGELWDEGNEDTPLYEHFADIVDRLDRREEQMQRGGSLTWWEDSPLPPDQMVYECDANLGSPALVDCNQLQWQGLGPTSDTVTINPETPKFFSSMPSEDTCNIAISATTTTTLMWRQLQTALNTLMNVCVENPIKSSQGGRAHFALNPPPSKYHRKRGKRDSQVTGLDALPPSVNVTIFAHDASSTLNCEWQAAQKDVALSSCAQV
ncbi:hypothetical protein MMC12_000271 [Toensbergia leucococca]|nr:hypothetical protein [Toensbergia leucococca]